MESIKLYRDNQGWQAIHTDPKIRELFGTDTLPTAFTKHATKSTVLRAIQQLNPECLVEAWGDENA